MKWARFSPTDSEGRSNNSVCSKSALRGDPLPPPLRRVRLWMTPKIEWLGVSNDVKEVPLTFYRKRQFHCYILIHRKCLLKTLFQHTVPLLLHRVLRPSYGAVGWKMHYLCLILFMEVGQMSRALIWHYEWIDVVLVCGLEKVLSTPKPNQGKLRKELASC